MATRIPEVSVVIPAYNQAGFLPAAIDSVLAQTHAGAEILVVDDGSTDGTPAVVAGYGERVRYIHQENQGLAGARNTGIRAARGALVALLDSDDLWLPTYLGEMMALAARRPEATVYYCGVVYIDEAGRDLPQQGHIRPIPPDEMYDVMLRANPLIPSTILLRREALLEAGLFDVAFRRLQDWELWVRLLRQGHRFAGHPACLVRYRIHDSSLSTDPGGGQRAARALVEKHFGPDDGEPEGWPRDKRRAYGGLYRYCALTTSVVRDGDWQACRRYLARALAADPTLVMDLDLFYELVLGTQPVGYRSAHNQLDLARSQAILDALLGHALDAGGLDGGALRRARGTAQHALALVAYSQEQMADAARHMRAALALRPDLWRDPTVVVTLLKASAGPNGVRCLRNMRRLLTER